jgi:hypothetical protein
MSACGRLSRENSLTQHGTRGIPGILPLGLTRSSLGFGQDDRGSRHGEEQCDLAGGEADSQEQWTAHALLRAVFLKSSCCAAPPGLHYYSGLTQPYGFACARLRLG